MANIIINPVNYQAEYLHYLNECFPGWGNEKKYSWVFTRVVGDLAADIIVIRNEEAEVIAGSGVTYRKLELPGHQNIVISIMTGSWTLPGARGKGCFSKIIALSQECAKRKRTSFLTAFVTETNASFRRLKEAGSLLVPTYHLFSPEVVFANITEAVEIEITAALVNVLYKRFIENPAGLIKFSYSLDEFSQQYIYRINKSLLLKLGNEYAIVEETHNVVMVLLLVYINIESLEIFIKSLSNWAMKNRSKKILLFSTQAEISTICLKLNFENVPGFFTILVNAPAVDLGKHLNNFNINAGDKM